MTSALSLDQIVFPFVPLDPDLLKKTRPSGFPALRPAAPLFVLAANLTDSAVPGADASKTPKPEGGGAGARRKQGEL